MSILRCVPALLLALLLAGVRPAHAHASLLSALPADGAVLVTAPTELVLRFDEPVDPLRLRLVDGGGRALELGAPHVDGQDIRVGLPQALSRGHYLFSYRVTSADSHPVGGTIAFAIGEAANASPAAQDAQHVRAGQAGQGDGSHAASSSVSIFAIVLRALRDLALLTAAGGALFVACIASFPGQRRVLVVAGVAAALLSVLGIGVQGAALLGEGGPFALAAWGVGLHASFGASALVAALGATAIALLSGIGTGRSRPWALALGALACIVSLPMTGHAAAAHPSWLARGALAAHALVATFWFGSLPALLALLRGGSDSALPALRRFSTLAVAGVAVLLACGVVLAGLQLESPAGLVRTDYGRLVVLKASLLLVLIVLATLNRQVLVPKLASAAGASAKALRASITAEVALIVAVLAATAVLVQTPPHVATVQAEPLVRSLESKGMFATVTLDSGRAGRTHVTVVLGDARHQPLDAPEVEIAMSNPEAGIEAMTRPMRRVAPGTYRHEGGELAFAGTWQIEVRARIDDFERVEWRASVHLH